MGPRYEVGPVDKDPIDPFTRVVNICAPLNLPRDASLRDCIPGIMTYGELLDLVEKYHRK